MAWGLCFWLSKVRKTFLQEHSKVALVKQVSGNSHSFSGLNIDLFIADYEASRKVLQSAKNHALIDFSVKIALSSLYTGLRTMRPILKRIDEGT